MRQRGFIQLSLFGWIAVGGAVALLLSWGAVYVQTKRLNAVQEEYATFVANTKALGEAQEQRTRETIERQKKESANAEKRSQRALADIRAKYDGLRQSSAHRGLLPPVPDTAPVADDGARDQRLLTIFQHAEEQTRRLEELQAWVRSNEAVQPGVKP